MTTVRHSETGFGSCVATRAFAEGETVLELSGPVVAQPTRESIELGQHRHIIDPHGSFVNHASTPNTVVNRDGRCLQALCAIATGDDITFDYNQNESCMAAPFRSHDGEWISGSKADHA